MLLTVKILICLQNGEGVLKFVQRECVRQLKNPREGSLTLYKVVRRPLTVENVNYTLPTSHAYTPEL